MVSTAMLWLVVLMLVASYMQLLHVSGNIIYFSAVRLQCNVFQLLCYKLYSKVNYALDLAGTVGN